MAALGVPAAPGSLHEVALTHRSFAFEQPEPGPHNERLEWLGDAILNSIIADYIFRTYPEMNQGDMTQLRASVVNTSFLAQIGRDAGIGTHMRLGKGEETSGGRKKPSLLADTFEALVGATYLERGLEYVTGALIPLFAEGLQSIVASAGGQDAKGALQERIARERGSRPTYKVSASGPDHDKRFAAEVFVEDELFGSGRGRSKRQAELDAAAAALDKLAAEPRGEEPAAARGHEDARAS